MDKQVFYQAASDVTSGLQYLHESGIIHRDLKPANILVSNQHYCQLTNPAKIEEISCKIPLICKLTDFGESRSQDIHTNTILYSKTNQVNRGTPVFMAQELLVNDFQLPAASVEDLKKADIWAYGMDSVVQFDKSWFEASFPDQYKDEAGWKIPGRVFEGETKTNSPEEICIKAKQ